MATAAQPRADHVDRLTAAATRRAIQVRVLLAGSFIATTGALVTVSAIRRIDRGDVFEIAVISIVWLTLIAAGPMVAVILGRARTRQPEVAPHADADLATQGADHRHHTRSNHVPPRH